MPLDNYHIIESTLREGEQFGPATYTMAQKLEIAGLLDDFGVEFIEMTTPCASPQSEADLRAVVNVGLRARILTHIRCHRGDATRALDAGVDGLNITIGTSPQLREHSHGKSLRQIIDLTQDVIGFIREQAPDITLRFSAEDTFRSDKADLLRVFLAITSMGVVDRLGVADTVGIAMPGQVYSMVHQLVRLTGLDVEFHGHNDSGCAIVNATAALEAGATHIDTTILGTGERNGVTSLGGLIARLYTLDRSYVESYDLMLLPQLDRLVAEACGIEIPFNNYITGASAFAHKAGIHAKAVLANPSTYEILRPEDFGLEREVTIGHRLTGWNAVRHRAQALGLDLSDRTIRSITEDVKNHADVCPLKLHEVDRLLMDAVERTL